MPIRPENAFPRALAMREGDDRCPRLQHRPQLRDAEQRQLRKRGASAMLSISTALNGTRDCNTHLDSQIGYACQVFTMRAFRLKMTPFQPKCGLTCLLSVSGTSGAYEALYA